MFTSNGLKTIEIYTTDDAGAVSNKVTLSFTLNATGIVAADGACHPDSAIEYQHAGLHHQRHARAHRCDQHERNRRAVPAHRNHPDPFSPALITTANASGNFTFTFPDMTGGASSGTFGPYTVVAQASNTVGSSSFSTPPTTFTILIGAPAAPSDFQLAPASDTGIVGDDITSDRTPNFIGTALPGETVELFESAALPSTTAATQSTTLTGTLTSGSASVTGITSTTGLFVGENVTGSGIPSGTTIVAVNSSTSITLSANATASGAQSLTATSFSIQLPFALTDGSISLFVEAIDPAGNQSLPATR